MPGSDRAGSPVPGSAGAAGSAGGGDAGGGLAGALASALAARKSKVSHSGEYYPMFCSFGLGCGVLMSCR